MSHTIHGKIPGERSHAARKAIARAKMLERRALRRKGKTMTTMQIDSLMESLALTNVTCNAQLACSLADVEQEGGQVATDQNGFTFASFGEERDHARFELSSERTPHSMVHRYWGSP